MAPGSHVFPAAGGPADVTVKCPLLGLQCHNYTLHPPRSMGCFASRTSKTRRGRPSLRVVTLYNYTDVLTGRARTAVPHRACTRAPLRSLSPSTTQRTLLHLHGAHLGAVATLVAAAALLAHGLALSSPSSVCTTAHTKAHGSPPQGPCVHASSAASERFASRRQKMPPHANVLGSRGHERVVPPLGAFRRRLGVRSLATLTREASQA